MTVTTTLSDKLRARIQALPFADRLFLLVGSIIGRDREAFSAISGLAELIVRMSGSFGDVNRFRVAEICAPPPTASSTKLRQHRSRF